MKKLTALVLLLCMVAALASCGLFEYETYEYNNENSSVYAYEGNLYEVKRPTSFNDYKAVQEKTVTFCGKEYKVKYSTSGSFEHHTYDYDVYTCVDDSNLMFTFRRDTGALIGAEHYRFKGQGFTQSQYSIKEDIIKVSDSVVRQHAGAHEHTDEYVRTYSDSNTGIITVTYTRLISGYETLDKVVAEFTEDGKLMSFKVIMEDAYSKFAKTKINNDMVNSAAEKKMKSLVVHDGNTLSSYSIFENYLVIGNDGDLLLFVSAIPVIKDANGAKVEDVAQVKFLIKVN